MENCRIQIEKNVRIGSRAFITKGVILGQGVQVFPGAVVQKSYEANTIVIGNPARILGKRAVETATQP